MGCTNSVPVNEDKRAGLTINVDRSPQKKIDYSLSPNLPDDQSPPRSPGSLDKKKRSKTKEEFKRDLESFRNKFREIEDKRTLELEDHEKRINELRNKLTTYEEENREVREENEEIKDEFEDLLNDYRTLEMEHTSLKRVSEKIKLKVDSPIRAFPSLSGSPFL